MARRLRSRTRARIAPRMKPSVLTGRVASSRPTASLTVDGAVVAIGEDAGRRSDRRAVGHAGDADAGAAGEAGDRERRQRQRGHAVTAASAAATAVRRSTETGDRRALMAWPPSARRRRALGQAPVVGSAAATACAPGWAGHAWAASARPRRSPTRAASGTCAASAPAGPGARAGHAARARHRRRARPASMPAADRPCRRGAAAGRRSATSAKGRLMVIGRRCRCAAPGGGW